MYQTELYYGYEEGECGIWHAFLAEDPVDNEVDPDAESKALARMLALDHDDPNFNWDSMLVNLPDSLVEKIQTDAIKEYTNGQALFEFKPAKDSTIILRADINEVTLDVVAATFDCVRSAFPDNDVVFIPDTMTLEAVSTDVLAEVGRQINHIIEKRNTECLH